MSDRIETYGEKGVNVCKYTYLGFFNTTWKEITVNNGNSRLDSKKTILFFNETQNAFKDYKILATTRIQTSYRSNFFKFRFLLFYDY